MQIKNKKKSKKEEKNSKKSSSETSSISNSDTEENKKDINSSNLKITKLILENFKSFEGRHEIGLFQNFTVVMGPNGSGKSNIIDALSFALGMNNHFLRTKNLKDLISKSNLSQKKNCSVECFFIENNKNEIIFKRNITSQGTSQYFFNGNKISAEDYFEKLEKRKIPTKTMFFILSQGAIDSIFSKKNKICETIELLSGSFKYKKEYEELITKITDLDNEINKLSNEINTLKDDKNKVKNQIEYEETYNILLGKINKLIRKIYLLRLFEQDNIKDCCEERLEENKKEIEKVENEKIEVIQLIKEGEMDLKKNESKENEISEENLKFKNNCLLAKNKISIVDTKIKELETKIFNKISSYNQMKNELNKKIEKKKNLQKEKEIIEKEIKKIKGILENDVSFTSSKASKEQIEEYKKISLSLQSNTISSIKKKENLDNQFMELENKKSLIEKTISQIENEKVKINEENKILSTNIFELNENTKKIEEELNKMKDKYSKLSDKKIQIENSYNSCYIELQEKIAELSRYELNTFENNKRKKISELMNQNEKVFGFLYELIIPLQKKLELPIKVSLIKYLNYLVVEDSETAFKVSEFLKRKDFNCDVLVLNNIPKKEIDFSLRLKLGNMGNLIIDLIECRKSGLKSALNFFLKDTVLCQNINNIKELRKNFNTIILLDGTVYKKSSISGGNYKNLSQFTFNYNNSKDNYIDASKNLKIEIDTLTIRLKEILTQKDNLDNESSLKVKIIEMENNLEINKKNIQSKQNVYDNQRKLLSEKEIIFSNCENSIKEINDKIEQLNNEKNKIDYELNSVKKQFFSDFMSKNKLKDLKDFEPFSINEVKRLSYELKEKEEKSLLIDNKINTINNFEQTLNNLDTQVEIDKKNKKNLENEKEELKIEYDKINNEYEKYNKEHGNKLSKLQELKNEISKKYEEIGKKDKRIRALLKDKVETQYKITSSLNNKKQIIIEAKTDNDKLLKDLGEIYQKSSIIFPINFNIEDLILKKEFESEYNLENIIIDYHDIEKENKDLNLESINQLINKKKEKLSTYIEEIQHYIKTLTFNEENSEKLKEKEIILNNNKKQIKTKIEDLIKNQEKQKERFAKIKNSRKKKFENYFKKLQEILNKTYKNLTESENNPGGNAFIYYTNKDEPYNGEIFYLPTPPGKRVIYDIEQLSGGEKTIAILSLLVSLQNISETPFLILDEVDAYLDPFHELMVEKLFKKIKNFSQVIIVTHKSNIFRSAESLLGTYFNKKKNSSIPISMNMKEVY